MKMIAITLLFFGLIMSSMANAKIKLPKVECVTSGPDGGTPGILWAGKCVSPGITIHTTPSQ